MLARAGLGDDPLLTHAHGQERLAHRVVELVRPGVAQVLALEVDVRAAKVLAEPRRGVEGRRPADERTAMPGQLELELRIGLRLVPHVLQLAQRAHQGLGHVLAAKRPEAPVDRVRQRRARHQRPISARRTASTKSRTLLGSLTRTRDSTPLETSTP